MFNPKNILSAFFSFSVFFGIIEFIRGIIGITIWLCLIFVNLAWISCFYRKHYMANKDQNEISRKLSVPLMTQPDNNVEDGLAKTDGGDKNRNSWK